MKRSDRRLRLEEIELGRVYLWRDGGGLAVKVTAHRKSGRSLVLIIGRDIVRWVRPGELRPLSPEGQPSSVIRKLHHARETLQDAVDLLRGKDPELQLLEGLILQVRSVTKAVAAMELNTGIQQQGLGPPPGRRASRAS